MSEPAPPESAQAPSVRRLLHDANDELSIAVLQLGILLEDPALEPAERASLEDSLTACSRAAAALREVWTMLDRDAAAR